jgi:ParB-like chromosome segregation protein Spo0J
MGDLNVTTTIPERRNLGIEAWLSTFPGVDSVDLVEFPLSTINVKKSHANQARLGEALVPELVGKYRRDIDSGALFPPIICTTNGVVADGNNRVAAHLEAGVEKIAAYVVDVNDTVFQLLALSANALNGLPNSPEAQAAHVVQFHNTGTFTHRQIAHMLGLSDTVVGDIVHAHSVRERVNRPRTVAKIPRTVLAHLDQIQSDEQLMAAVEVVASTAMKGTDVRRLVNNVKKARTIEAAFSAISEAGDSARNATKRRATAQGAAKPTDVHRFLKAAGLIQSTNPTKIALAANGSTDQLVEAIQGVLDTVAAIEKALAK